MMEKKYIWSNPTHFHIKMEVDNQYAARDFAAACNRADKDMGECPVGMFDCPMIGIAECKGVTEEHWKNKLHPGW